MHHTSAVGCRIRRISSQMTEDPIGRHYNRDLVQTYPSHILKTGVKGAYVMEPVSKVTLIHNCLSVFDQLGVNDDARRRVSSPSSQPERSVLSPVSDNPVPFEKNDPFADIEVMSAIGGGNTGTYASRDMGTEPEIPPPEEDAVECEVSSRAGQRGGPSEPRTPHFPVIQSKRGAGAISKTASARSAERDTWQLVDPSEYALQLLAVDNTVRPSSPSSHSQRQALIPKSPQDFPSLQHDRSTTIPNTRPTIPAASDASKQNFSSLTENRTPTKSPGHALNSVPFSARFPARISDQFGDHGRNVYPSTLDPQLLSRLLQMQVQFGFDSHDVYDTFLNQNRDLKATMNVLQANREFLDASSTTDDDLM